MAHNIISGTVTNRARVERRTPNWLRAFYAVLATLVLVTFLGMIPQIFG
jgi:type VI protein secretion system component VasF